MVQFAISAGKAWYAPRKDESTNEWMIQVIYLSGIKSQQAAGNADTIKTNPKKNKAKHVVDSKERVILFRFKNTNNTYTDFFLESYIYSPTARCFFNLCHERSFSA